MHSGAQNRGSIEVELSTLQSKLSNVLRHGANNIRIQLRKVKQQLSTVEREVNEAREQKEILERDKQVSRVIAIGPAVMMKFCSSTTKPFGVTTIVSLNSIMVDGTGMCGCCRVSVGGITKFACVDGPDFDAHKVDFDLLVQRQGIYLDQEKLSWEQWKEKHKKLIKNEA